MPAWFDIHLEIPESLDRVEEAYVRRDLLIGSELHLAANTHLPKARGFTLIEDDAMSAFLADAEEPTHLKWNASRPLLAEEYKSPKDLVKAVRQALPRFLTLLCGGESKRDAKALARYFTKPAETAQMLGPRGSTTGSDSPIEPTFPITTRKPIWLATGADWVAVRPNGKVTPPTGDLPITCVLRVAYEGLEQDPFETYDPFDFNLADGTHNIEAKGATITNVNENIVEFKIESWDFDVVVGGFDPRIRLRATLTYEEEKNGSTVDSE